MVGSRQLMPAELEQLIGLVREREPLWNKYDPDYVNRVTVNRLWAEITAAMEVEEFLAKKKWKYLRDQYCVELKKSQTGETTWRYFNDLSFLKDIVKPRDRSEPPRPKKRTQDQHFKQEPQELDEENEEQPNKRPRTEEEEEEDLDSYMTKMLCEPHLEDEGEKNTVRPEQQRQEQITQEDEDLLFFKSLLPHVRKIRDDKKLVFRGHLQVLVQEFAYEST